jgi:hypothetical protein
VRREGRIPRYSPIAKNPAAGTGPAGQIGLRREVGGQLADTDYRSTGRIHNGGRERFETGQTHLVLARVHAALGHRDQALEQASRARRILGAHNPGSTSSARAAALVSEPGGA